MKIPKSKDFKFTLCLHKAYFETGGSIIKYFLYLIAFFGMSSNNVETTMILAVIYAIAAYVVGILWFKYGFYEASIEVGNVFNKFVKEVRHKIGSPKSI